jgi:hypothetical protein
MKQEWNAATLRGIYRDGNRSDTVSSKNEFRLNMIEEHMVIYRDGNRSDTVSSKNEFRLNMIEEHMVIWLGLQEASITIQDLVIWGELLD